MPDRPRLLLALAASAPASIRLARGEREPPLGWVSPGLEQLEPAWICLWEPEPVPEVILAALLQPVADEAWTSPRLELDVAANEPTVSFSTTTGRRSFLVRLDDLKPFQEAGSGVPVPSGRA
jgi:hypothetical protein